MPDYVVERVAEALNTTKKAINGSRVHILGVAYKRDVNDMRESPALDIIELLAKRGAAMSYTDPWVPELRTDGHALKSVTLQQALADRPDCVVICTDHSAFQYDEVVATGVVIVDTRNALKDRTSSNIFRL
jgi:UDP-N-acetyl-D-glucosamine dehydrogenase